VILVRDILVQNFLVSKNYLETIKILDGVIYHLEYHQLRVNSALKSKTLQLSNIITKIPKEGLYRCRIVYNPQEYSVNYIPYTKRKISKLKLIYDDSVSYEKKYENRELFEKYLEEKEECDDVLIIKNGLLTDTSIANIALYDGKQWLTPKEPLLEGTCRARLLDKQKIYEADIRIEDFKQFEKIALMNAMIDFDIIATEKIEEVIC